MELPEDIYDQVETLSAKGCELFDDADFPAAITKWSDALDLLPEPKSEWDAYTWR